MKKVLYISGIIVLAAGCRKVEFEPSEKTSGEADFTRYIAVGNSLTQGFQDGGLYEEGQQQSYPWIIANQMLNVEPNMDEFRQPDVYGNGSGYMHLEWINGEIEVVSAGDSAGYEEDASWADWGPTGIKYSNLGIAGITLDQCVALNDEEAAQNHIFLAGISFPPFFEQPGNPYSRFLDFKENPNPTFGDPNNSKQYIDFIRESDATFFTCWLGNNDVLGYATGGGVVTEFDASFFGFGTIEFGALTDVTSFRMKYDSVLTAFTNLGAKGICATIPDVTVIPYFNTFTVQSIKEDKGYSEIWIEDGNEVVRVATDEDLILLSASDAIDNGAGSSESDPLTNDLVLDEFEKNTCIQHTIALNAEIMNSAEVYGYPVLDVYSILNTIKPGVTYDGVEISPEYISGGGFSLDGIHLNPRGYCVIANEFIKAINAEYGSTIPLAPVANYRGVIFP